MLNIVQLATEKLQPNDYNPNMMTEKEFSELTNELRKLGRVPKPIVVRKNGKNFCIVDGEHNWRAAKEVGFETVTCEIIKVDDFQAMCQTYKRNQHGIHNPALLGKMFQRMMDKRKLSQRALAKEIDVSEGTIRNTMEYTKAYEVRNDYAFDKLTVKQIRYYNRLPKKIADIWLDCGADILALWRGAYNKKATKEDIKNAEKEWIDENNNKHCGSDNLCEHYTIYDDPIIWECLRKSGWYPKNSTYFISAINIIKKWLAYENKWRFGITDDDGFHGIRRSTLRNYTKHYYNNEFPVREEDLMNKVLNILINPRTTPPTFILSPDEFDDLITEFRRMEGSHNDFMDLLKVSVRKKTGKLEKDCGDVREEMMEMEIRENAPDYIQTSELKTSGKYLLWKADGPEWKKRELAKKTGYLFEKEIESELNDAKRQDFIKERREQYNKMTREELAGVIVGKMPIYDKKRDGNVIQKFITNLSCLTKFELVFLAEYTEEIEKYKSMVEYIRLIAGNN